MKILYVITSADSGGAQQYVLALAKKFGGTIAVGTEQDWLFNEARALTIPTIPVKHLRRDVSPYHDLIAVGELRRIFKQEKPDIIHLNSSKAGVIGAFAAKKLKIPVVYTVHGFVLNEPMNPLKRALYRYFERSADRFRTRTIAVSRADQVALIARQCARPEIGRASCRERVYVLV